MGNAIVVFGSGRSDLALYGEDAAFFFGEGAGLLRKFDTDPALRYLADWLEEAGQVPVPAGSWFLIPSLVRGTGEVINPPYSGLGLLKLTEITEQVMYELRDDRFRPLVRLLLGAIAHRLTVAVLPAAMATPDAVSLGVAHMPVQPDPVETELGVSTLVP